MRYIEIFECEICGAHFENEYDCRIHEKNHRVEGLNGIKLWDKNGNRITGFLTVDDVYAFKCESEEDWKTLEQIHDEDGVDFPSTICYHTGHWYYYDHWHCIEEDEDNIQREKNTRFSGEEW